MDLALTKLPQLNPLESIAFLGHLFSIVLEVDTKKLQKISCLLEVVLFFGDVKEVFFGYFADPNRSSSWCFLLGLLLCDECCFNGNSCPELLLHWYRVSESVLWRMWTIGRIGIHGVYTCNADVNLRFFRYSAALSYHKSPSICPCLVVIPSLEFRSLRFRNASFLARCQGEGTILQGWQTMSLVTQWCFKLS